MMQFILITLCILMSFIFLQLNHPLAMGLMLLIQTLLMCLITGLLSKSFWFSYILFLIFLGGMLVLFIYMTALSSNEMFTFSSKLLIINIYLFLMFIIFSMFLDSTIYSPIQMNSEMMSNINLMNFMTENTLNLNKLYNYPTNMITILLINYLLLTLIIIVKITHKFYGPLRMKNN